jgi:hypothetical protein
MTNTPEATDRLDAKALLEGTMPGPWELFASNEVTAADPTGEYDITEVCATYGAHHGEANARLIAAAPRLAREHAQQADEITALKAEIARLREALDEAVICLSWIASLGYEGAPDIAMRKAAMASLAKINAALRQPQAGGHDER